jgi:hypothetical protein
VFRLVAQAAAPREDGSVEWTDPDVGPVGLDFAFANGAPLLQSGWFAGLTCVAEVTR